VDRSPTINVCPLTPASAAASQIGVKIFIAIILGRRVVLRQLLQVAAALATQGIPALLATFAQLAMALPGQRATLSAATPTVITKVLYQVTLDFVAALAVQASSDRSVAPAQEGTAPAIPHATPPVPTITATTKARLRATEAAAAARVTQVTVAPPVGHARPTTMDTQPVLLSPAQPLPIATAKRLLSLVPWSVDVCALATLGMRVSAVVPARLTTRGTHPAHPFLAPLVPIAAARQA